MSTNILRYCSYGYVKWKQPKSIHLASHVPYRFPSGNEILKFLSTLKDPAALIHTLRLLDQLVLHPKPDSNPFATIENIYTILINSFRPLVLRFFTVPTHHSFKFNEILASFLEFLLQILDQELRRSNSYDHYRCTLLVKELTYLLTFLGDQPFQHTQDQLDILSSA